MDTKEIKVLGHDEIINLIREDLCDNQGLLVDTRTIRGVLSALGVAISIGVDDYHQVNIPGIGRIFLNETFKKAETMLDDGPKDAFVRRFGRLPY